MTILINGKPLYKRKTPTAKLDIIKEGIKKRKNVDEICTEAGVTAHTVRMIRERIANIRYK